MENLYLGFDAGTQSVKVSIYNKKLECLTSHSLATTLHYPQSGWVEMDIDEFLNITVECIRLCVEDLKENGIDPKNVVSIMGDGIICGIAGINAEGKAITPYINYLDSRTQDDVDHINAKKLDIWSQETGNPTASCMFPAMFARWFIRNNEEFQKSGVKFVHNAPYILMHLAGLKAKDAFIDWGTMSGWGLGYNVIEKQWSEEQLQILGIDFQYMPKIVKPWDIIGTLSEEMAQRTGLSTKTIICGGAGDTMQSMIGCGNFEVGKAVDVAGTCAMFCVSTNGIIPELSKPGNNLIFNSGSLPNTYFYWGFIRTGGLALRWFKDSICQQKEDPNYYQTLSQEASKIPVGSRGVLFLPYLTGGQDDTQKKTGAFLGLTLGDDQATMWRSVLESIGYDYMEICDIYKSAGANLDCITVTEGGSRDSLWNQIKSDMLESRVVRYKNKGGAVITNCLFGAYAVGDLDNLREAINKILILDESYEPSSEHSKKYRQYYKIQRDLIRKDLPQAFSALWKLKEE